MKTIYIDKGVPSAQEDLGQWRSIEFELIFNSTDSMNEFIKFIEDNGHDKYVTVKYDGSIEADFNNGENEEEREVVVSYRSGNEQVVRDICAFLKGKAYVNSSCGTHVHFDMRGVDLTTVKLYGKRLAHCVPALKKILPKSRRNNEFCQSSINRFYKDWNEYNSINKFYDDNNSRYAFVNMLAYMEHQTIEVRAHSGTLSARKILNWIKICEKIMTNPKGKGRTIESPDELIKHYKLNERLSKFITERYEVLNAPVDAPQGEI